MGTFNGEETDGNRTFSEGEGDTSKATDTEMASPRKEKKKKSGLRTPSFLKKKKKDKKKEKYWLIIKKKRIHSRRKSMLRYIFFFCLASSQPIFFLYWQRIFVFLDQNILRKVKKIPLIPFSPPKKGITI